MLWSNGTPGSLYKTWKDRSGAVRL
jgi:hypothetical protein